MAEPPHGPGYFNPRTSSAQGSQPLISGLLAQPANTTTGYSNDYQFLLGSTAGGTSMSQTDLALAPATPTTGPHNIAQPADQPAARGFESSRLPGSASAMNPLLAQLVEHSVSGAGSSAGGQRNGAQLEDLISVNPPNVDILGLLRYGEDLLAEVMAKISDIIGQSRGASIPVDKSQAQQMTRRLVLTEDMLKGMPLYFKRLRIIRDFIDKHVQENSAGLTEELIPVRDDPVGAVPVSFETDMRQKVRPELWSEYLELKEKLITRDRYLKTIIDAERSFLQNINCILYP